MKFNCFRIAAILLVLLTCFFGVRAQDKTYTTATGQAVFFSETPAENISAVNKKVQAILKPETNEIAVRMKMTEFVFPNKLMQEHFNENYMESSKYPVGSFSGKINQQIDYSKDGTYDVSAEGSFSVHGVIQNRKLTGTLQIRNGKITIDTQFDVALKDHKIEVPTIVFIKIAQVIQVKANVVLEQKGGNR